jgi:hypothetical protein
MLIRSIAVGLVAVTCSTSAMGAVLLGMERGNPGNLVRVDTTAQTSTVLGPITVTDGFNGCPDIDLAPDGTFVVCAPPDGSLQRFSAVNGSALGSTPIAYPTSPEIFNVSTALEYVGSTLYAAFDVAGPEIDPGALGTINPQTGATTLVGVLTGMNAPAGGLAYNGTTLYAVSSADSVFSELYTVNLATGAATKIANITLNGQQVWAMTALTIEGGVAFTKSNRTEGGTNPQTIYSLNLATGALTPVYTTTFNFSTLTSAGFTPQTQTQAVLVPVGTPWVLATLALLLAAVGMIMRRGSHV